MAAKAVQAFRSQKYSTCYRISNISAEWETEADKRCTATAMMAFAKPITIHTHTHKGRSKARPLLCYFSPLVLHN